ncbi:MSF1-domain-containing protein [Exidia glandulosa HHB12029]|uniref:MSF1-domain-containing protein n=1 Tax=Exidia glandulosa HHB12029 TaxID=1314781 RepID=A0A165HKL6_EXIGL|nr:MSF1-domain-containing protein [Exidia glandulosa HHB12029]
MKLFSQSFHYDDNWTIVALAFFLRYPNPYASHVLSCDVISREFTDAGALRTTRLILKRGNLPAWFPAGIMPRQESWVVEESEVDPHGRVVRCVTRNLDHVKSLQVIESTELKEAQDGKSTFQHTDARFVSRFGWGLTKRIEQFGAAKFKANVERSRQGISLVLRSLRELREARMHLGAGAPSLSARLDFSGYSAMASSSRSSFHTEFTPES